MLKVGMIGGAVNSAVGMAHFDAIRLDGRFSIVAGAFSRNAEVNAETSVVYNLSSENVYDHWAVMLKERQGELDAVVILTPTPDHCEMVCEALALGFNVIVEKALCTSLSEVALIQAALEASEGKLLVTYNYSGYPMIRELRALLREGRLGDIQQIHIEMPQETFSRDRVKLQEWRQKDYEIPTVSLDLGVHVFHLLSFLSDGAEVKDRELGQYSIGNELGLIDNVFCRAELDNGALFNGWWGKTALGCRNGLRVRVFGSRGAADWLQQSPEELVLSYSDGRKEIIERGIDGDSLCNEGRYNRFKPGHPSGFIEAFANLYCDFYEVLQGAESNDFVPNFEQTARCMEFLTPTSIEK